MAATTLTTLVAVTGCADTDDPGTGAAEPPVTSAPTTQASQAVPEPTTAEPGGSVETVEGGVETVEAGPDEPPTGDPGPVPPGQGQALWVSPPENELGQPVDLDPVVAQAPGAAVAVTDVTAYSTGVLLDVAVRVDPATADGGAGLGEDPMGLIGGAAPAPSPDDLPDDLLRLEVTYPDGSVASTADEPDPAGGEPEGPVLGQSTGQGSGTAWDYDLWLWPLPEGDGVLELALVWPERGIDTRAEVEVAELVSASEASDQLWPAADAAP